MIPQLIKRRKFRRGSFFDCLVESSSVSKQDEYVILLIPAIKEFIPLKKIDLLRLKRIEGSVKTISNYEEEIHLDLEDFLEIVDQNLDIKLPKGLVGNSEEREDRIWKFCKSIEDDLQKDIKSEQEEELSDTVKFSRDKVFIDDNQVGAYLDNGYRVFIVNTESRSIDLHIAMKEQSSVQFMNSCGLYRNIRELTG